MPTGLQIADSHAGLLQRVRSWWNVGSTAATAVASAAEPPAGCDRRGIGQPEMGPVPHAAGYEFQYRLSSSNNDNPWVDVKGFSRKATTPIIGLKCERSYDFRAHAKGDGNRYTSDWIGWSDPASVETAGRPRSARSAPVNPSPADTADGLGHLLSWAEIPGVDRYAVEIPMIGYFVHVPVGSTERLIPASLLSGLRGRQTAIVWSCDAWGVCIPYVEKEVPNE